MFPIPFNFPFRKKDGSMTTISQAISEGGGSYTLPTASETTKGGIKVGAGLTMDGETLKNTNPNPYILPTASAETLGGIKVGSGLSIDDGVLSASGSGSGGSKFTLLDDTGHNGQAFSFDWDLSAYDAIGLFMVSSGYSNTGNFNIVRFIESSYEGSIFNYQVGNDGYPVIYSRKIQYSSSTGKVSIGVTKKLVFASGAYPVASEQNNVGFIKGIYGIKF